MEIQKWTRIDSTDPTWRQMITGKTRPSIEFNQLLISVEILISAFCLLGRDPSSPFAEPDDGFLGHSMTDYFQHPGRTRWRRMLGWCPRESEIRNLISFRSEMKVSPCLWPPLSPCWIKMYTQSQSAIKGFSRRVH